MRIDPKTQLPPGIQTDSIQEAKTSQGGQRSASDPVASGGVQVQLSTDSAQVANLAQQAASIPPVRTGRVDALRQAVRSGTYQPTNEQIAAAMYSDMSLSSSKP